MVILEFALEVRARQKHHFLIAPDTRRIADDA